MYVYIYIYIYIYIANNHPIWLIFFRGVETTNQMILIHETWLSNGKSLSMNDVRHFTISYQKYDWWITNGSNCHMWWIFAKSLRSSHIGSKTPPCFGDFPARHVRYDGDFARIGVFRARKMGEMVKEKQKHPIWFPMSYPLVMCDSLSYWKWPCFMHVSWVNPRTFYGVNSYVGHFQRVLCLHHLLGGRSSGCEIPLLVDDEWVRGWNPTLHILRMMS